MKKIIALFILGTLMFSVPGLQVAKANPEKVMNEKIFNKKKKNKGYKKPRSKKILGIFKRKSDCGCPKH
jgi:hypothetical protein